MKAKVKYSEETGIQKLVRMKKEMKRMEEMDEAMMEARAMRFMSGSYDMPMMPKMKFGCKKK
jgi:hypothetical protein